MKNLCRLFFFCIAAVLPFSAEANDNIPFDVAENLVSFSPGIRLESGGLCQGYRVLSTLVATSLQCAKKAAGAISEQSVSVLDAERGVIGIIDDQHPFTVDGSRVLLPISNLRENDTHFDTVIYTAGVLPERNTAYYLDETGGFAYQAVSLSLPSSPAKSGDLVMKPSTGIPDGAPVLDSKGNLVCIVSSATGCHTLSPELSHLSRTLMSSDDADAADAMMPYTLMMTAALATAAVATTSFYTILLFRAKSKGMPTSQACRGLCCYGYCAGWESLSTVFCVIGGVLCPLTNGVCSVPFWWSAAFAAAWNWVNAYNGRGAHTDPLLPIGTPPEYSDSPSSPEIIVKQPL